MTKNELKNILSVLGADLSGVASLDRFSKAPDGFHPLDVLPSCKSVIAFACEFPKEDGHTSDHIVYTRMRDYLTDKMDEIAEGLCTEMRKHGIECVLIAACDSIMDSKTGRWRSIISIKHASEAAGLGTIGRHSLLITPEYGSLCWLGCVLCDVEFEADELCESVCDNCGLCVNACPVGALEKTDMDQLACDAYAYREEGIVCHACRDACPFNIGLLNK